MDNFILYTGPDGQAHIELKLIDNDVWLSSEKIGELFGISKSSVSEHIKNINLDNELDRMQVVRKIRTTASDGKNYEIEHYNLKMILHIGYRVRSHRGVQFRQWATTHLHEFLIKGFTLDDDRLKNAGYNNAYFEELLERIRDIRTSEKNFYFKVKEIYKLSADYDAENDMTKMFFRNIQNKFHWASHGHTAAEVIFERADANKPTMGLTTWNNQKKGGRIRKSDVTIAKNYLQEDEIKTLNLLVEQFLAFAETQARSGKVMYMRNWIEKLESILSLNGMNILEDFGKISAEQAKNKAESEYIKFKEQEKLAERNLKELEKFTRK